jgi:predicted dehydrogenase
VDPLRWGVLGVAKIAVGKVIPAFQRSAQGEVTAIASRDMARAMEAAARLGIQEAYGSYEELLGSDGVDAVYVPLPNHLHKEWTLAAARSGKHVLCEKPLALTAADAAEMVEACAAAGVLLMEGFMYRLHPSWQEVRRLVSDGAIGELRAIHTRFAYFNDDPEDIRNRLEYGGGALMDIGCYAVNLSRMLFGEEPTRVAATIQRDPTFGTDIVTSALLEFEHGHATFTVSTRLEPDQRVHLAGSQGRIEVEIPFNIPPDRKSRIHLIRGGEQPVAPNMDTISFPPADPYTLEADAFGRAVREGVPVPIPPEDGVANMRVIERIIDAAG